MKIVPRAVGMALAAVCLSSAAPAQSLVGDPRVAEAVRLARTWLEAERAYERVPGLSAEIVHDQEVLWSGAFGEADIEAKRPASTDTIYSICSISKLFTSVALMRERDAGRLRLDDPVELHLSWFRLAKSEGEGEVTIEGLLTHASGLPRESDFPYWSPPDFRFPTHDEIVARVSSQKALYAPERFFQYSNLGLTLAGEIVAATSAVPYDRYVKENVLGPLGLSSTTSQIPETERGKRLAAGYTALDREGRRAKVPFYSVNGIGPAAGYASTAGDLGRFASWQFRLLEKGGTEILRATTLAEMQRVHWVDPDFETFWGLGFAVRHDGSKVFVGHGGSCPGYRTHLLLMPAERIATVVLVNASGTDPDAWARRLYDIVAPAVEAAKKEPGKGKAADPELERYAGTYDARPWDGEIAVVPWKEGLAMLSLPSSDPLKDLERFRKTGEHTFRRIRKDDTLGEELVFEMGPDGRAKRFLRHSNFRERIR